MILLDDKIVCYSYDAYYLKEESGRKNNVVRLLEDKDEVREFMNWYEERKNRVGKDLEIEIVNEKTKKSFIRQIVDISIFEDQKNYGDRLVIFSFENGNNKKAK